MGYGWVFDSFWMKVGPVEESVGKGLGLESTV